MHQKIKVACDQIFIVRRCEN